jgi:predicted Rossmann-fold nucleotide-binding protein
VGATRQDGAVSKRRAVEVESVAEFDRRVAAGASSMDGWRIQDVDLTDRSEALRRLDPRGALFLGGRMDPVVADELRSGGALVFEQVPDVPVDVYRTSLYTPNELYDDLSSGYDATVDARTYAWTRSGGHDLRNLLAQTLHDLSVDDALEELVHRRRLVGVMGGHDLERGSAGYEAAARLGRTLARSGLTVATGGGPGAMEAANLGAYLSTHDDEALGAAMRVLADVPSYTPDLTAWAHAAFAVRERWPDGAVSLGVPTWFYGHEPPNAFAGAIAKYFKNAIREDVLLHVCRAGIVFLPGRGGTVQEVFQDACENYYAADPDVAPMVLVGRRFWTQEVPAWPLLRSLAEGRTMAERVHLVDHVDGVPELLGPPDTLDA